MLLIAPLAWAGALTAAQVVGTAAAGVETATVTGWVVDANGWLDKGFFGTKHEQSAVTTADLGAPLVILTDRGSVVYPVTLTAPLGPMMDNARLIPFAEQRVTVTGKVVRRGKERGIVIQEIAKAPVAEKARSFPARETANVRLVARVTDLSFWLGKGDSGAADIRGAQARAEDGESLVLVSDSGYVYYPVVPTIAAGPADIPSLMKYCEQRVRVTGKVIRRGSERGIVIDSVAAYLPGAEPESPRADRGEPTDR
jgi:hypothetical protein